MKITMRADLVIPLAVAATLAAQEPGFRVADVLTNPDALVLR